MNSTSGTTSAPASPLTSLPTSRSGRLGSGRLVLPRPARALAAVLASGALVVAPVVTLPAPAAYAVEPGLVEVPLDGVDASALRAVQREGDTGPTAEQREEGAPAVTAPAPEVLTAQATGTSFDLLGVTWDRDAAPETVPVVQARVLEDGEWGDWFLLAAEDTEPDPGTAEYERSRGGSSPLVTGGAEGYQVRVDSPSGRTPADLTLRLVDAGTSAADARLQPAAPVAGADAAVGQPPIISRAQWGADEGLRSAAPAYSSTIKVGVVHHTASTNNYTASEAAAQVRAIYAYHTKSLGWSDIGYNFLVDKFGRTYEGRAGGVERPVVGAHAGGFNKDTFGVAALGTYTTSAAPAAMVSAISRVTAWKLALNDVDPYGSSQLTSAGGGTARWPAGTVVTLPNVIGHRQVGNTTCPGDAMFSQLATIKAQAKALIGAGFVGPSFSESASGLRFTSGVQGNQSWRVVLLDPSGATVRSAQGTTSGRIEVSWPRTAPNGAALTAGRWTVRATTWAGGVEGYAFQRTFDVVRNGVTGAAATSAGVLTTAETTRDGSVEVRTRTSGGSWSGVVGLGGGVLGAPALTYRDDGSVAMAVRGTNGYAYTATRSASGTWSRWTNTFLRITGAPGLTRRADGRLEMVARSTTGAVGVWSSSNATSWAAQPGPGGGVAADTGAGIVQTKDGAVHVVVIGTDGQGWTKARVGTRWGGWRPLGGALVDSVMASTLDGRGVVVSGQGTNAAPYVQHVPVGAVGSWRRVGSALVAQAPAIAATSNGVGALVATSPGGDTLTSTWSGRWAPWVTVR